MSTLSKIENSSRIGLGTAVIGRPLYINIKEGDKSTLFVLEDFIKAGENLLDLAYQRGIRIFDTSPGYGMSERLIHDWLQKNKPVDVDVFSKWGYTYVADFKLDAKVHEVKEHSIAKLNEQWAFTQQMLPHLKIYQIHSATLDTGVLENKAILARLYELKNSTGVQIGLTTTGENQVQVLGKALKITLADEPLFDSFQVTYNVFDQSIAKLVGAHFDRKIIVKEALANGRVFRDLDKFPKYQAHYDLLLELSKKYDVGIDAVALRFCMDSIPSDVVLSGASTIKQLDENMKAYDFQLTKEEISRFRDLEVIPMDYWNERKKLSWN